MKGKKLWIGIFLLISFISACKSPGYELFVLSNNTGGLKEGDKVVMDGATVGKVALMTHPPGRASYTMIKLDLKIPFNLPAGSRFIFPDTLSEKNNHTLFIVIHPSSKIFHAGDTINLLEKSFDNQITIEPVKISSKNKSSKADTIVQDTLAVTRKIVYRVQVKSSKTAIDVNDKSFMTLTPITRILDNGLYKYFYGEALTFEQAKKLRILAVGKGFSDAFISAFNGNRRISVSEARTLEN